jgi:hypothetical protein
MVKKLWGFFLNFLLSNKKHQETQIQWLAFVFPGVVVSLQ